jgi:hypothetical protein
MKSNDTKPGSKVQGEGDYDAARRHRRDVERFVQQNDTEELARDAQPDSPAEADELEKAEAEGRSRSADPGSAGSADAPDPGKKPDPK